MWEFWRSRMSKGKTRHRRRPESEGEELTRSPTAATNPPGRQPPENSTHVYFKDIILPASDDDDDDDALSNDGFCESEDGSGAASAFSGGGGGGSSSQHHPQSSSSLGVSRRSADGGSSTTTMSRLHPSASAPAVSASAASAAATAAARAAAAATPAAATASSPFAAAALSIDAKPSSLSPATSGGVALPTAPAPPPPPPPTSSYSYSLSSSHHRRRRARARVDRQKLIIILVGLPGRGKTFLCNKLLCYLNWLGHETRHFNVGQFRRAQKGETEFQDASFFDHRNAAGRASRERALSAALDEMERWLGTRAAQIAVFDATNSTAERRAQLRARFHGRWQYLFIESICNDPEVLEMNYRFKMMYSPDYAPRSSSNAGENGSGSLMASESIGCKNDEANNACPSSTDEALADFRARIKKYEEVYETITDRSLHYIKLIDMVTGKGYMDVNRISGYIPGKIVFFLMQVCKAGVARVRKIWLTRHGESEYNLAGKLGGDSPLSARGESYARLLPDVIVERVPLTSDGGTMPVSVWTSTLVRTIQTAELLPFPKLRWKVLDEIQAGAFDGWTYAQIEAEHPSEFQARKRDKLRYRYPAGESYMDVVQRLEPAVIEVERERECVCVVAHQAILRALYGYFTKTPLKDIPRLEIPLHTLIELVPKPDGRMAEERVEVDVATGLASLVPPPVARDPTAWTPWSPGSGGLRAMKEGLGGGGSGGGGAAAEEGTAATTTTSAAPSAPAPPQPPRHHESNFGHASEPAAVAMDAPPAAAQDEHIEVASSAAEEAAAAAALAAASVSGGEAEMDSNTSLPPPRLFRASPAAAAAVDNSDAASAASADAVVLSPSSAPLGGGGGERASPPPSDAPAASPGSSSSSGTKQQQRPSSTKILLRRVPSLRGLSLGRRGQSAEREEKKNAAAATTTATTASETKNAATTTSTANEDPRALSGWVGSSGNLIGLQPREPSATSSLPPPSVLGSSPTGSYTSVGGGEGTAGAAPAPASAVVPGDRPPLYPERTLSGNLSSGGGGTEGEKKK